MITRCEITYRETFEIEHGVHHFDSLIVSLSGLFEYSVGGVTKTIPPYHPLFCKKGTPFYKKVITPIQFIIISAPQFPHGNESFLTYEDPDKIRLEDSVIRLKKAITENEPDHIKEHFVNDILLTAKHHRTPKHADSLSHVYDYISRNFEKKISLSFLADMGNCSQQTFLHKFKICYGTTPVKCITGFRIAKAKDLLANTDYSVSQIAEACGYDNVYYFSNTFKKETGLSPLKYRQSSAF